MRAPRSAPTPAIRTSATSSRARCAGRSMCSGVPARSSAPAPERGTGMFLGIAAVALALALQQQTDTTFAVRAGRRLVLDAHDGAAIVRVWDRQQIRVQATHNQRGGVRIRQSAAGVSVEAEGYRGPALGVRFEITVPRAFGVAIDGVNIIATVDGVQGDVGVDNVEGAITIRNVVGNVSVESVSGSVTLENVRGNVRASSTNQGLHFTRVRGN